jgi:hypothetical protein
MFQGKDRKMIAGQMRRRRSRNFRSEEMEEEWL